MLLCASGMGGVVEHAERAIAASIEAGITDEKVGNAIVVRRKARKR